MDTVPTSDTGTAPLVLDLDDMRLISQGVEAVVEATEGAFAIAAFDATFIYRTNAPGGDLLVSVAIQGSGQPTVTIRPAPNPTTERSA